MNSELLQFAMYLTGDGEEDIEQMYYDWINSPSTPNFAPERVEASKTDEEKAKEYADIKYIKPYDDLTTTEKGAWLAFYAGFLTACQYKAQQLQQSGMQWVKCSERLPKNFGMYITKIRVKDNGLTFIPVAYNQFDTLVNDWTNPMCCGTKGEILEWLDKSDTKRQLSQQQPAPFTESWKQHLQQQIDELRKWKAEAIAVMPDYQAIGKALGVPLGQSIHDKILPAIQEKDEELAALRERVAGLSFMKYAKQSQLMKEMAGALGECRDTLQFLQDRALPNSELTTTDIYNRTANPINWIEQIADKYNNLTK
jgi:hypothetical protein